MSLPPPDSVPRNPAAPLFIVISAPSGGGKTTLCQQLLAKHPEMTRAITCTTRAPRPGERDGADYHFLDAAAFARRVAEGDFLEHATVYGHAYGTPKAGILERLRQGQDVLLNVDVQGASTICTNAVKDLDLWRALVTVFLTPRSLAELEGRLRKRATDSEADLQQRLSVARTEIAQWQNFQYLIISTSIAEDLRRMECIIEAERMRPPRALPPG
ncbi:MAG TPA: guanylate kinase [Candidatus Acidoferrum sp.]|nr:guanylate kinase [Candidatus Acidoferrum sp.]